MLKLLRDYLYSVLLDRSTQEDKHVIPTSEFRNIAEVLSCNVRFLDGHCSEHDACNITFSETAADIPCIESKLCCVQLILSHSGREFRGHFTETLSHGSDDAEKVQKIISGIIQSDCAVFCMSQGKILTKSVKQCVSHVLYLRFFVF